MKIVIKLRFQVLAVLLFPHLSSAELLPRIELGGIDSSVYGFIAHSEYANYLSPRDAAVLLLDYGSNEFRLGLTWGRVLTPTQRIKLSVEHFAQENTFDFAAYPDGNFSGQNQFGLQYEYAATKKYLEAFIFRGYYFQANGSRLSDVPTVEGSINQRFLTGGMGGGINLGPRWRLWPGAQIDLGIAYDQVHFSTKHESAKNSSGFGQNATFLQKFIYDITLEVAVAHRKPYQQYSANIHWPVYHSSSRSLGLQLAASHLHSSILPAHDENIIGLSLTYQWGGSQPSSQFLPLCFRGDIECDLIQWASHSAAYLPGVFVQRDQQLIPR